MAVALCEYNGQAYMLLYYMLMTCIVLFSTQQNVQWSLLSGHRKGCFVTLTRICDCLLQ